MTPERWQQIDQVFQTVVELNSEERIIFLDKTCGGDEELRREVESLLSSDEQELSLIESPAFEVAAPLLVSDRPELEIGRQFGSYKILALIARGGMGEVYLARDERLERKIALKLLPAEFAADENWLRRFKQEAKVVSALNHPNIVTIHEVGEIEGRHFITTEFVEGETLRQSLKRGSFKLKDFLDAAIQVCTALSAAHRAGVVHLDVKPENIMLRRDGYVKVLDFGLSRIIEKELITETNASASNKTKPVLVMGTIKYMSPEQARGREVDARSDIFSFGVVLYEMLTGGLPFNGKTTSEIIAEISKSELSPLTDFINDFSPELEQIILKTLAKKPDERYQSSQDLLNDLRELKQKLETADKLNYSHAVLSVGSTDSKTNSEPGFRQTDQNSVNSKRYENQRRFLSYQFLTEQINGIKQNRLHTVLSTVALFIIVIGIFASFTNFGQRSSPAITSVAVLPFVNETKDPKNEYLSDGMTETLIGSLSKLQGLSIKARSSVFHYKGKEINPRAVGNELAVQAVLLGRISQRDDVLTLNLELVDAKTENIIWNAQYARKQNEIISLQSEIARDVSSELRIKLAGADERKVAKNQTQNAEAFQFYLQGRFYWNKRNDEATKKAFEYFEKAIEKDPNYALAYVGLAETYIISPLPTKDKIAKAKVNALKALEIDETLGEAHAVLGNVINNPPEWNFAEAEKEYKRAIELNPSYATARHWYGEFLAPLGRFEESLAQYNRALELDPLSLAISSDMGMVYYYARQYDRAIEYFKKLIEMDPNYVRIHLYLTRVYEDKGMFEEALAELERGYALRGDNMQEFAKDKAKLENAFRTAGAKGYWQKILDLKKENPQKEITPWYSLAMTMARANAHLGERDAAIEWLEKAHQEDDVAFLYLKVSPDWDNLRSDPRFQDLLRRMKFAP